MTEQSAIVISMGGYAPLIVIDNLGQLLDLVGEHYPPANKTDLHLMMRSGGRMTVYIGAQDARGQAVQGSAHSHNHAKPSASLAAAQADLDGKLRAITLKQDLAEGEFGRFFIPAVAA